MPEKTLKEILAAHTQEGELYTKIPNQWVRCSACGHQCTLSPGREGICKVRFNRDGVLYVPWGYVGGIALDPIEKKPFFHAYPGSTALSFGMLGCDYHCSFCQNWVTSQVLRDPSAGSSIQEIRAEAIVQLALQRNVPVITSTYNEPLITSEWGREIFRLAKKEGLITSYVSNGNGTTDVLEYLSPWIDLFKIDLKSFRQEQYRQIGGTLHHVLDTIRFLFQRGIWIEIVTLVIPGINDSDGELTDIAQFIMSLSPDIPWHVTAYHEDYLMKASRPETSSAALLRAADIGVREGLHFVYTGNCPGQTKNYENTYCPSCHALLIERAGFRIVRNRVMHGTCFSCGSSIAGRWNSTREKKGSL